MVYIEYTSDYNKNTMIPRPTGRPLHPVRAVLHRRPRPGRLSPRRRPPRPVIPVHTRGAGHHVQLPGVAAAGRLLPRPESQRGREEGEVRQGDRGAVRARRHGDVYQGEGGGGVRGGRGRGDDVLKTLKMRYAILLQKENEKEFSGLPLQYAE